MKYIKIKDYKNYMLFIIFAVIVIVLFIKKSDNRKIVINNYKITTGKIVKYYRVGEFDTPYLTYEYIVNGKTYSRKINPNINMDTFFNNKDNNFKYVVIYSKFYPDKSLIDLINKISSEDSINSPISISNFE